MMAEGTLDDLYLEWLYNQVGSTRNRNPAYSYWSLARQLYSEPFNWTVRNDGNRESDGKDLRDEFIRECNIEDVENFWLTLDCSMLEMLVAFARRVSYASYGEPSEWFWKFMFNMGIRDCTDSAYTPAAKRKIKRAMDHINRRTYDQNGVRGLFPLRGACDDQREVELWYQMSSYLYENDAVNVLT